MSTTPNGVTDRTRLRSRVWAFVRAHPIVCIAVLFFAVLLPVGRLGMHQVRQAYIESFPTLTIPAFLGREEPRFDVIHHLDGCLVVAMPEEGGDSVHYRLLPEGRTDAQLADLVKKELRAVYPAMTLEAIRAADLRSTRYKHFQEVLLLSYPTDAAAAEAKPATTDRRIVRVDYGESGLAEAIEELKAIGTAARRARAERKAKAESSAQTPSMPGSQLDRSTGE